MQQQVSLINSHYETFHDFIKLNQTDFALVDKRYRNHGPNSANMEGILLDLCLQYCVGSIDLYVVHRVQIGSVQGHSF